MRFRGCYTAIITPMREDGALDLAGLDRVVDAQLAAGVAGIVCCGTTGESPTLSHDEQESVIGRVVARVARRCHVMAGTGSNDTAKAVAMTKRAKALGADSTLQVVPYYNKPSQEGLYRHFAAVAEATDLPVCLYNIPGRSAVGLEAKTIARLAALPTVRAIKEAARSLELVTEIRLLCDIDVLSGDDALTLPMLAIGGTGVVSVASNVAPRKTQRLVDAFFEGKLQEALALHHELFPLIQALFCEPNPVPSKHAARLLGLCGEAVRLPLAPITDGAAARVRQALRGCGLLPA